jgi:hypothetical protein
LRLAALSILIFCLVIISRNDSKARLTATKQQEPTFTQTQPPIVTAENQAGTPLVVSGARLVSVDPQSAEIAFRLTNVCSKTIRAFAIKEDVGAGGEHKSTTSLVNLDLTNSELRPNDSTNEFSSYQPFSEKEHHITLSVDYVEFSDGTSWGLDSAKSAERTAGQRAALQILSKRLIKVLNAGNSADVITAIDAGVANIEPPTGRSEEWKEGFRLGCKSVVLRLKRAQGRGGWIQVDSELRQLAERSQGAQ